MLPYTPDAEDACQEALIKVSQKIGTWNQQGRFTTWLHVVAVNSARSTYRRMKNQAIAADPHESQAMQRPDPRTTSVIAGTRLDLLEAMETLEREHPQFVEPLLLRDVYGLPYEEIATLHRRPARARSRRRSTTAASWCGPCSRSPLEQLVSRLAALGAAPPHRRAGRRLHATTRRPRASRRPRPTASTTQAPSVSASLPSETDAPPDADDPALDPALSEPVEDSVYPDVGDPSVDSLHYDLDLAWTPDTRTLVGDATIELRSTSDRRPPPARPRRAARRLRR